MPLVAVAGVPTARPRASSSVDIDKGSPARRKDSGDTVLRVNCFSSMSASPRPLCAGPWPPASATPASFCAICWSSMPRQVCEAGLFKAWASGPSPAIDDCRICDSSIWANCASNWRAACLTVPAWSRRACSFRFSSDRASIAMPPRCIALSILLIR